VRRARILISYSLPFASLRAAMRSSSDEDLLIKTISLSFTVTGYRIEIRLDLISDHLPLIASALTEASNLDTRWGRGGEEIKSCIA
jgi:hypothetical protein